MKAVLLVKENKNTPNNSMDRANKKGGKNKIKIGFGAIFNTSDKWNPTNYDVT